MVIPIMGIPEMTGMMGNAGNLKIQNRDKKKPATTEWMTVGHRITLHPGLSYFLVGRLTFFCHRNNNPGKLDGYWSLLRLREILIKKNPRLEIEQM